MCQWNSVKSIESEFIYVSVKFSGISLKFSDLIFVTEFH